MQLPGDKEMKRKKKWSLLLLAAMAVISAIGFINNVQSTPQNPNWSKVVFVVSWFDVGKDVLEGLKGVKSVENGFRNFKEVNTVWYDPAEIQIPEMEQALKNAGTYVGIAEWSNLDTP